ncbi:hypothetical protein AB1Y20_008629 [Prymnesium parvum]|uniref:Tellurium resistance protein TerC n=1 Tax=Prymnesium parvum TaxID=97485 RepID=A0AB34ISY2_PRYPA
MGREGVLRLPANSTRRAHPLVSLPHATAPPPSAPPHLLRARPKPHLNATRAEWPNPSDRTRVTHARLAHNASRHAHAEAPAHNASRHAHAEAPAHNASRHAHAEAPAHDASRHAHAEALPTVGRAAARSILHLLVPFALALCAIVAAEDGFLRGLPALKLRHAACWLLMFGAFCVTTGLLVAAMQGWEASGTYFFCLGLNVILSPDNLVVFMMLLQQAKLPVRYHFRAISHGLIVAAVLRTIAMIGGAFLLNHFAWLQLRARFELISSISRQAHCSNPCASTWH